MKKIEEMIEKNLIKSGLSVEDFEKLVKEVVSDVCNMVNIHTQNNNKHDCTLVVNIKESYGIEANKFIKNVDKDSENWIEP